MEITFLDICLRLAIAVVLGLMLGLERLHQHKTIGMRVYSMVAITAALFMSMALMVARDFGSSPDEIVRMMGQLAVGIGFLGGGIIVRLEGQVQNITTAAALWVAAGVGVACGLGYLAAALVVTVITLILLEVLVGVEKTIVKEK